MKFSYVDDLKSRVDPITLVFRDKLKSVLTKYFSNDVFILAEILLLINLNQHVIDMLSSFPALNPIFSSESFFYLGTAYQNLGHFVKALESFNQIVTKCDSKETDSDLAKAMEKIGHLYLIMCDYDKALTSFEKSLSIYEKMLDGPAIATAMFNVGLSFQMKGNYDKALEYISNSVKDF